WFMLAAALVGVVALARWNAKAFAVTMTIAILLVFSLTHAANKGERYALLLVPLLSVWAGAGLYAISNLIAKERKLVQAVLIVVLIALPVLATWHILYNEFILPDTCVRAVQWLDKNAPREAVIVRE